MPRSNASLPAILGGMAASIAMLAIGWTQPARAAFPERTITAIIPFSTGGQSDVQGRIIAAGLSQVLGQSVVVENKPGAGGNLGIGLGQRAKPDGYTIVLSSVALTINPALYVNLGWDPNEIQPVAIFGETPTTLTVNAAKYPTDTLKDFVARAKANPGKMNFGSANGGINEELFALAAGIKITTINYPGSGDATNAAAGGEVDAVNSAVLAVAPFVQGKDAKLRVLAVAGSKRSSALPDVPSASEAGVPGFNLLAYIMMVVPKATPKDIQQVLNSAANKVVVTPDIIEKFRNAATDLHTSTIADSEAFFQKDIAAYKKVIEDAKIPKIQ